MLAASLVRIVHCALPYSLQLILGWVVLPLGVFAQVSISGVINQYTRVTDIDYCTGKISVSSTAGFVQGEEVLLIQMQGAVISTGNNSSYGQVLQYGAAGQYERFLIDSVGVGVVFPTFRLKNNYEASGKVQLVSIPVYSDVVVQDTLRPASWNGSTGGVLALKVTGDLKMLSPVSADGAGFRGGAAGAQVDNFCNWIIPEIFYTYGANNWRSSPKGEGVAVPETGKEWGRGAQANGGGGGNDHNSGGGGGSNTTAGGIGGRNNEPSTFGCSGNFPGVGGWGLINQPDRLFMGGGGGAGHSNNTGTNAGGAGGGVLLLDLASISGTNRRFTANGLKGQTSEGDGGGGGGGGGSISLRLGSLATGITLQANGGSGGNTDNSNQNRCFGPGGGGGGGNIRTNLTGISTPSGGAPGEVTNATGACNASSNDAAYGAQGVVGPWTDMPQAESGDWTSITTTDPTDVTVCRGKQAVFAVVANAGNWEYRWQYNTGAGWTDVPASPPYQGGQSPVLTIAYTQDVENGTRFRCQVSLPGCSPAVSNAATLTLVSTPIPGFSISQQGNTLQLLNTATGATAYYWTFGDGTTATTPTPTHTYLAEGSYTITQYAINACDTAVATQTITILAPPQAGFSVPASTTDCNAVTLMPKNMASTNATSIEWKFPGGQPPTYTGPNPSVTYLQTGTYTITQIVRNTAGADTLSKTVYVQADPIPFAAFNIISIVNGELKVQNLSAPGAVYVWNFGDGTPLVTAFEPSHVYTQSGTYVITLNVVNLCGASILQNQIQIVLLSATDQGDLRLGVFPNPTPGIVQVVAAEAPDHLRLLDMNGRLYQEIISCSTQNTLDLSTLPDGFYVIQYIRGRQVRNIRIGKVSE